MTKKLKCFISAPANVNTSVLRKLLDPLDVETYDLYDFKVGERIVDLMTKRIKQADFAIIIISEKSFNAFYETGICEGLGKPLFIIVDKDIEPTYFLQKYIYLKTDLKLENEDLLEISLKRFVHDLRFKKNKQIKKPKESKSTSLSLKSANDYIDKIENLRTAGHPIAVEQLAQELFGTLNLQFASNQFSGRDKGVDFAIWDDGLAFTIGNPLFIEIKYGALTTDQIHRTENQLKEYIAKTEARAAILLYLDKNDKRFRENYSFAPLILRYDLEDFVRDLSKATFQDVILSQRNKIVHGVF